MSNSPYPELRNRFPNWNARRYFARVPRVGERLMLAWIAPAGVCLLWVAVECLSGHWPLFQSGPVSSVSTAAPPNSHADFNTSCRECHVAAFAPLGRLWFPGVNHGTVPDGACGKCHDPTGAWQKPSGATFSSLPAPAHHRQQLTEQTPGCANCHHEHRGKSTLRNVHESYCTGCHADLKRQDGEQTELGAVRGFSLTEHPPIRWPADRGKLQFSHAAHLNEKGPGVPGRHKPLECADCHRVDAAGRYMQPIRYENHCQKCHPLAVPHGKPPAELVELLRARYAGLTEREEQLKTAKRALFLAGGGCRFCHEPKGVPRADQLPEYEPTKVETRWLSRAVFSHAAHEKTKCDDCHAARTSARSGDVVMPTLETCAGCHGKDAKGEMRGPGECRTCHRYHAQAPPAPGG